MYPSVPATCSAVSFNAPIHTITPQVGPYVTDLMGIPAIAWLGFFLAVLIIGIVIIPAVWSKRPARRKAAAEVLDRIVQILDRIVQILRPRSLWAGSQPRAPSGVGWEPSAAWVTRGPGPSLRLSRQLGFLPTSLGFSRVPRP